MATSPATQTSIEASLDHHARLAARRQVLHQAQVQTEEQVIHRLAVAYGHGEIVLADLIAAYTRLRGADPLPGLDTRWNARIPVTAGQLRAVNRKVAPNGPGGSYQGAGRPGPQDPCPPHGIPVVYVLFDEKLIPAYVGSTQKFRDRMRAHARDGKPMTAWTAHVHRTREDAYQAEDRMLREVLPYLNRRAGR